MAISPNLSFRDFAQKIDTKFHKSSDELLLKFEYDDGAKIALQDDDDYELAIETARASARGYPTGKLSVWVFDY